MSHVFKPCETCPIGTGDMTEAERMACTKGVSLIRRAIYLDIVDLGKSLAEMRIEQAAAITGCLEAQRDETCAFYAE